MSTWVVYGYFLEPHNESKICRQQFGEDSPKCSTHGTASFRLFLQVCPAEGAFLWAGLDRDEYAKISLNHGTSKEPLNPWPEWIHWFLSDLGSLILIQSPKERSLNVLGIFR